MKTSNEKYLKRIEEKTIPEPNTGCLLWTTGASKEGYGFMIYKGYRTLAHRVVYMLYNGDIPNGAYVLHKCDTPACCNIDHLFIGTQLDNMRDMIKKGRQVCHNRKKTHCLNGHEFNYKNTHITKRGHRTCRRCHADREFKKRNQ